MSVAPVCAASPGLRLDDLVRRLSVPARLAGDPSVVVRGVRHDSRSVAPGDLFAARKGDKSDGFRFLDDAIARGAVAVLVGADAPAIAPRVPLVVADDFGAAFADAASIVYGSPSEAMSVVGITGTNGKTTTAYLVRAAVDATLGRPSCGVMGTVGNDFAGWRLAADHTTPEADEVARAMAQMRMLGATHVAMEVSSHAIVLGRVRAVRFRVAAFANLTQDHLDFHGSMEEYGRAKARLFTELAPAAAVVNVDDAFGADLAQKPLAGLVKVSARTSLPRADVFPRSARLDASGIHAVVATPRGEVSLDSPLLGAHNLDNLLLALGIACALDLDVSRAAEGLSNAPAPPGRLERCDGPGDEITVLVDYAHTPAALARALETVRAIASGRVWCVFGCGGDRDTTKRAPMGEAAARLADGVVVTSDNPRSEDPAAIAAAIAHGVLAGGAAPIVELDRQRAIERTIDAAAPGDVVLVAGKGHEDYQWVGGTKHAFDDRRVARGALARRRRRTGP
jgi:UDP-N-acetylmuramoyl-L-alanyl-D-glutamate--2,6-diaminopimelate ligase